MTRQLFALIRKELKLFRSDRRAVLVGIVTPIAIASFFGALFSGKGQKDTAKIPVLVADADRSRISQAVTAGLAADALLDVKVAPEMEARDRVRRGKTAAAVLLPKGFGEAAVRAFFGAANAPEVTLLVDPSRSMEAGLVRGLLSEKIFRESAREMFGGMGGRSVVDDTLKQLERDPKAGGEGRDDLKRLLQEVTRWQEKNQARGLSGKQTGPGTSAPFLLREEALTAGKGIVYNSYAHSFAGMGIQFLLFTALDFGIALLLERQGGLWKRLRSAPLSRATLLLGKTLSGAVIGLISIGATFAFGIAVFGIRIQGSVPGFVLLLVASTLMASAFGLLLAAIGKTPAATRGVSILAVLILVMLGGGWIPAFLFPAWLQNVTLFLPTRWAIDGLDAVTWRGAGFVAGALPAVGVLLAFTILFLAIAWARFPWEEG